MAELDTPVSEMMTTPVRTVDPDRSAREAATILVEEGIGSVLVAGPERGIFTKTDLLVGLSDGVDPDETPVSELMSTPVRTVEPTDMLRDALEEMSALDIKRIVVDNDGDAIGVVTTTDVVDHLSPDLDQIVAMFVD